MFKLLAPHRKKTTVTIKIRNVKDQCINKSTFSVWPKYFKRVKLSFAF